MRFRLFSFLGLAGLFLPLTTFADATTTLDLNDLPNKAVLEDDGDPSNGLLQLRAADGSFETITFSEPDNLLIIRMGDGNDELSINNVSGLTADIIVMGQGGNDRTVLFNVETSGSVTQDDFAGDNFFAVARSQIGGDVSILDGSGLQTLACNESDVSGNVIVTSTGGGSQASIFFSGIVGALLIDNDGFGDDRISIGNSGFGVIFSDTGDGDTFLTSGRFRVRDSFSSHTGTGEATHFVEFADIGGRLFITTLEGATDLRINEVSAFGIEINNGLGFDKADLHAVNTRQFILRNGDGGSRTGINTLPGFPRSLKETNIGSLRVINGEGSDEVVVGEPNNVAGQASIRLSSLTNYNGSGNSTLKMYAATQANFVTHGGGDGFDNLLVDGATIRFSLTSANYDGGSLVELRAASVGSVDVNSNAGTDFFRIRDTTIDGPAFFVSGEGDDTYTLRNSVLLGDTVFDAGDGFDILENDLTTVVAGFFYTPSFEFLFPDPGNVSD